MRRVVLAFLLFGALVASISVFVFLDTSETPRPTGPVGVGPGSAVFVKNGDLFVAPLDTNEAPRRLTLGSLGAGYAGYAHTPDGHLEIFYISMEAGDGQQGDFEVFRLDLGGGAPERLVGFHLATKAAELSCCLASVSPDGRFVAYSDESGLRLRRLDSGTDTLLSPSGAKNGCVMPGGECFANYRPLWSPKGDSILFDRFYYEGGSLFRLNPFAQDPKELLVGTDGYAFKSWSPDGKQVCSALGQGKGNGNSPVALELQTGKSFLLSSTLLPPYRDAPLVNAATGCAWAPDGRIAFSYLGDGSSQHVAVLDASRRLVALLDGGPVAGWIADGSGVVYRAPPEALAPEGRYMMWIPGQAPVELSFQADRVLGILPD